jgi:hypothetical protein
VSTGDNDVDRYCLHSGPGHCISQLLQKSAACSRKMQSRRLCGSGLDAARIAFARTLSFMGMSVPERM